MTLHKKILIGSAAVCALVAAGLIALPTIQKRTEAPTAIHIAPKSTLETHETAGLPITAVIAEVSSPALRADLEKLYAENNNRALWTDGRTSQKRLESIDDVSRTLVRQGIDAATLYNAKATAQNAKTTQERAQADVKMSIALLTAARGQRFGFIAAKDLGWNLVTDEVPLASLTGEAAAKNRIPKFFESLQPQDPQFRTLTDALSHYRDLAAKGGWPEIPEGKEIDLKSDPRLPVLRDRLIAEGYLSPHAGTDSETLKNAVKTFQTRNGLESDGRAGRGTIAALNVSAEERADQIVANLERWRHMRRELPGEYVLANVADQSVVVVRDDREYLRLRAVVGTRRHATPMLEAKITAVTVNPPWEIPTSIITNEILPKLDNEPDYLIDNDMEVVSGSWDRPRSLRLRQRPGAGNSLGYLKFQMQNEWNIYLHDTPSRSLFAKDERYFSHGCVRVDQPQELAMNLLPGLAAQEIQEMIAAGDTRTMKLEKALPVFVLYWSVFTDKDGKLQFRRDAYARDATTVAALSRAGLLAQKSEVAQAGN
ncbi:MAG: murein L,D-transpeptidase [Rhodospirillaceae bacterium]